MLYDGKGGEAIFEAAERLSDGAADTFRLLRPVSLAQHTHADDKNIRYLQKQGITTIQ